MKQIEIDTIYNDDAYKFVKNLKEKSIDCVYIDIPYLLTTGGGSGTDLGNRYQKRECELMGYDKKLIENSDSSKHKLLRVDKYKAKQRAETVSMEDGIDYSILNDFCRIMKKINIFIWCSEAQMQPILDYFVKEKHCYFKLLVWAKTNAIPVNSTFLSNLEYCLYFREPGVKFNSGYELRSKWYLSGSNKADKQKFNHPTIKPLNIVENHLLLATQPGDIVLDVFSGSGTTAVACINTGRHYICCEKNEAHWKTSVDRINCVDQSQQTCMFTR